jgi:aldehyde dehydrogenase (NAD+)
MTIAQETATLLRALGVDDTAFTGGAWEARSPIDGSVIGAVTMANAADVESALARAASAFSVWCTVPAPKRGELVRLLGEELRAHKDALAALVTIEAGKVSSEGAGEVQEMIDIADFAVGLSRQLHGLTIATERPQHRMMEQWHPLGIVGIITAFNFPVAVWAWNAALALVCGDPVIWKPSEKTPLTALAVQAIMDRAMARYRAAGHDAPDGLTQLLIGGRDVGAVLVDDPRIALLSATGSTAMGRIVAPRVAARFGRSLLELGGNNGAIIAPSADLDLALRGVAFAAMGTAGQRCTTLRRLFVHDSIYDAFVPRLHRAFASVQVGDPRANGVLVGPLIDVAAAEAMESALASARAMGARIAGGDRVEVAGEGVYVRPALAEITLHAGPVLEEVFAPILYVMRYSDLDEAIACHNAVTQGLSSAIFTTDMREAEHFLSAAGSDCGIANVNLGTSGAEIGGAFGGEKETGGGRESGSDAWRAYMRRATNSINYGRDLPLAQGVKFDL